MNINYVNALWMSYPDELSKLVGFEIETFYTTDAHSYKKLEYIFWEKGKGDTEEEVASTFFNGESKTLKASNIEKKCFAKLAELRNNRKDLLKLSEGDFEIYDALKDEEDSTVFNLYKNNNGAGYVQVKHDIDDSEYEVIIRKKEKL